MMHDFEVADGKLRLWQRAGESYEHVLMKALGYSMYVRDFPSLTIEPKIGLRYVPDLLATDSGGDLTWWGECGQNSFRKTHWILKHTRIRQLVLFKIGLRPESFLKSLRDEIPARYRPFGRLQLINFSSLITSLTESRQIAKVSEDWFTVYEI